MGSKKYPPLTRKEAEEFKDDLCELFLMTHMEEPHLSFKEICQEVEINISWVREWASNDPDWQDMVETIDAKPELPTIEML